MRAYLAIREERSRGRPLDLLLVDRDADDRRALAQTLGQLGHLVVSASSLGEAARMLRTFDVDAVVCDVRLPDGDGDELFARWPADVRRKPAIAIGCDVTPDLAERCRRAGFDACLAKPIALDAIVNALRAIARRVR